VAVRHPWRWVVTAGALVLVAQLVHGLVTNPGWDWATFAGYYAKILARWNLADEAVTTSEINPPGLPIEGK